MGQFKDFVSRFRGLYWKLSGILVILLAVLAVAYVYITTFTSEMYYQEASQRLNAMVAPYIAHHLSLMREGKIDEGALKTLFSDVMTINPSLEVYLLDPTGRILAYSAPDSVIKRKSVHLAPLLAFLHNGASTFQMGDDPRGLHREKVFSAAALDRNGHTEGYLYVILGGEEYDSSIHMLFGSYILRLGFRTMGLTLIGAAVLGLLAFGLVTRSLRKAVGVVRQFQSGDHSVRIPPSTTPEFNELATAFNEMADAIVRQLDEIKSMDMLRRDLVANVSHDLRTPLVSIHGYVETILMKDRTLTDNQRREYLKTVLHSTERLKTLVEELLELSKLEAKQTVPKLEQFSLAELVQDVIQKYRLLAEERRVGIRMELPRRLPYVYADISLIERVFQNLLDNAVKYTPENGSIMIVMKEEGSGVHVNIADTGPGISEDDLPHIFDRFHRGTPTPEGGKPGSGLGLAIVKKILEIHGVTITVSSTVQKGTAFSFRLPGHADAQGLREEFAH
jgi:signal transduction histidine kinase